MLYDVELGEAFELSSSSALTYRANFIECALRDNMGILENDALSLTSWGESRLGGRVTVGQGIPRTEDGASFYRSMGG